MGLGGSRERGTGAKEGTPTCTHCPVGLVALLLTWFMVEVLIVAGAGVKAKTMGWPWDPPLTCLPCLPCSLLGPGIRDKQGVSIDKVPQDTVSVGTTQATTEQLGLAAQCLLGQPAHVSHREHLSLGSVASLHGYLHQCLQGDATGGRQESACHPQGHQPTSGRDRP